MILKKYGILILKIFLWIIGSIIFLLLLVFVLIRVPAIQDFARKKAVTYLEEKIKTKVEINRISLDLPKLIVLEDIYFEDQKKDTLLAGDKLKVDISLLKLLNNTLEINTVDLRGITANIQRDKDSVFNFDYIIKAFVSGQKKTPKPEDTTSAMKFSLDKVNLNRIKVAFKDAITANDVNVFLGHFNTRVKTFDLDKMQFEVPKITLANVNARVIQRKPPVTPKPITVHEAQSSKPISIALQLGTIDLDKIKIYYQNDVSAMKADVNLGNLEVESDKLDLKGKSIALRSINFTDSKILFVLGKKPIAKVVAEEATQTVQAESNDWKFTVADIQLDNNDIRFDNFNLTVQKRGMDFAHLSIRDFKLDAEDLIYTSDTISGTINEGSFEEKSGFDLKKVQTKFFYGKTQAYLNDLDLQTDVTRLNNDIHIRYPSIESLSKNLGALHLDANLDGSRLGFKDILTFVPALATTDPFRKNPNASISINGQVNGKLNNLNIPSLEISGFGNTYINASAKITGLPDMNKAFFDVSIGHFTSGLTDIAKFLPTGTLPSNFNLPESFKLTGTFTGGINNFNTDLNLSSNYGSAKASASYNAQTKGSETYKANVRVFNFNVGKLLKQEREMGRVTLAANITGKGTNPKNMRARVDGKVIKAEYNQYTYRNLNINAIAKNGAIAANAEMQDPNLDFEVDAIANLNKKYPAIKLALDLDSVNLKQLNFSKDDLRFRGHLLANIPTADPNYLNGNIQLTNTIVAKSGKRFQLDSITVSSVATPDSNSLRIKSEFLTAHARGKYKLTEVGSAIQNLLNNYFTTGANKKTEATSPQQLTFNAQLVNAPILKNLAPEIRELATVNLAGSFNSQTRQLVINGNAPRLLYGSLNLNNFRFTINSTDSALNYSINLDQVSNPQVQLLNTSIIGKAEDNVLTADIRIRDRNKKQHYRIAGALKSLPDAFEFRLRPDSLVLNYEPWLVSADNAIQYGKAGLEARNFVLSNNNQKLSINTSPAGANNPMAIDFSNFKIETLTQMIKKDSLLIGGNINGNVLVRDFKTSPVFTSDFSIDNFNFKGDTVGNIALKVNNESANAFAANMRITGKGNDVELNGHYYTGNSSFDMELNIANLNLKSIEGFTMGNLEQASGSLNGQLDITGTPKSPKVLGEINFKQTAFNISMLNSYFRIPNNQIEFTNEGIRFDEFTLIDSANNSAVIDGIIYTQTYTDYRFGLSLNTDNFQVMNSTATDNELYYGKLLIDTRLRIQGTPTQPVIDGRLKINPETKLTVVLPQTAPGIEEREGIVEFVDKDNPQLAGTFTSSADTIFAESEITGMDVSVNLEVDKKAEFNLIVDAANGDFLKLRGEAQLNGGIDPSGKTSLTGTYTMEEGAYELSFNFLRRRFDIKPGSTITWNGEPTDANLNVTAIYIAETAPLDLVENQLGDAAPTTLNTYKQKLPFEVHLTMKGELMKPRILFNILLPEKNYNVSSDITTNVDTRLTQLREEPTELNKQVFALLLLNRFVSENPFRSSAGGGGVESLARQSVSKMLSQQLNNLAGDLIAGVELNFDLASTEDYTTGQLKNRTDLNVGLSKRLLNDRLKVTVGSNFELEGPQQPNRNASNIAGNIEAEYQLSKDGRYLLRAYQKDEYQVALQGQVIETGVGFVITMDYNKFIEIFTKRKAQEKNRRREERLARKQDN